MDKDILYSYAQEKAPEFSAKIFSRMDEENIGAAARMVLIGVLFAGMDKIVEEEFCVDAKRAIDIYREECLRFLDEAKVELSGSDI